MVAIDFFFNPNVAAICASQVKMCSNKVKDWLITDKKNVKKQKSKKVMPHAHG